MAAAVLLAGGGTYWAVAASDDGRDGSARTAASDARGTTPPVPGGTGPGIAPGEPDPNDGTYRVTGSLPDGPDKAYTYRHRGVVTAADVSRLAEALGVAGTPRKEGIEWRVGPEKDGTGPSLTVLAAAPGEWRYSAAGPVSDSCPKSKDCPGGYTRGKPVGEEAAKKAAAPVLKALGLGAAPVHAAELMDALRVVSADPVVGRLPTMAWSTDVRVAPDGQVVGASGRVLAPVRGAEYPVISAEQAVEELNSSVAVTRGGTGGCASPVPLDGGAIAQGEGSVGPGTGTDPGGPCDESPGATKPVKERVTIHSARFGLASYPERNQPALVPAWLFEGERDGRPYRFSYPAVPLDVLAPDPDQQSHLRLESYRASDRQLKVGFTGGVCSRYVVRVEEESATRVRLRLYDTPIEPGRVCILIAVPLTATVTLEQPLGDRAVVDAVTGKPVPRT
ncbi:membrane protein [Streptomyces coeruleoprunus]